MFPFYSWETETQEHWVISSRSNIDSVIESRAAWECTFPTDTSLLSPIPRDADAAGWRDKLGGPLCRVFYASQFSKHYRFVIRSGEVKGEQGKLFYSSYKHLPLAQSMCCAWLMICKWSIFVKYIFFLLWNIWWNTQYSKNRPVFPEEKHWNWFRFLPERIYP